jgi:hypothetical protein
MRLVGSKKKHRRTSSCIFCFTTRGRGSNGLFSQPTLDQRQVRVPHDAGCQQHERRNAASAGSCLLLSGPGQKLHVASSYKSVSSCPIVHQAYEWSAVQSSHLVSSNCCEFFPFLIWWNNQQVVHYFNMFSRVRNRNHECGAEKRKRRRRLEQ